MPEDEVQIVTSPLTVISPACGALRTSLIAGRMPLATSGGSRVSASSTDSLAASPWPTAPARARRKIRNGKIANRPI